MKCNETPNKEITIDIVRKVYDSGFVRTIRSDVGDYSELSKNMDNVMITVTSSAAVSRGNNKSKNPKVRYKSLKKEAAPDLDMDDVFSIAYNPNYGKKLEHQAGRPLEFAPVVLRYMFRDNEVILMNMDGIGVKRMSMKEFNNDVMRFSFIGDGNIIYTTMRTIVNNGIDEEKVVGDYPEYYKKFLILKVKAPYFVFAQLRTHGELSQVAESVRVLKPNDLYLPLDFLDRIERELTSAYIEDANLNCLEHDVCRYGDQLLAAKTIEEAIEILLKLPVGKVKVLLKHLGYKKELYNRWPSFLEYKTWNIAGWLNDPYGWGHFLLEREAFPGLIKSWVQRETQSYASVIREVVDEYVKESK